MNLNSNDGLITVLDQVFCDNGNGTASLTLDQREYPSYATVFEKLFYKETVIIKTANGYYYVRQYGEFVGDNDLNTQTICAKLMAMSFSDWVTLPESNRITRFGEYHGGKVQRFESDRFRIMPIKDNNKLLLHIVTANPCEKELVRQIKVAYLTN